jgi:quinohemoprotein ethanol dehydrogenase
MVYATDPNFKPQPFRSNAGWGGYTGAAAEKRTQLMQQWAEEEKAWLVAYDPAKQEIRWQHQLPRHGNGGVMITATDLVFEGTTKQTFAAFDALTGKEVWSYPVQSAPVAGPITYEIDGEQYIAVNAGWGGGAAGVERAAGTALPRAAARLIVFKLGATKQLPVLDTTVTIPSPPPLRATEAEVQRGAQLFAQTCAGCHGQRAVGGVKDLRHMTRETHAKFNDIVLGGIYVDKGMASFKDLLNEQQVSDIHAYLIARANEDWGENRHQ